MYSDAITPDEYVEAVADNQKDALKKLRKAILENLPEDFEEVMSYGMIGYVVPKRVYPKGYKVNPDEPLPFAGLAAQKNHISLYHMGVYMYPEILDWFVGEYSSRVNTKLDMGKSCIRFKNPNKIPYELVEELFRKISAEDYIDKYEKSIQK
ncbi:DUF1801 domain-containing protein [Alkalibacter saccharofermentans]|uniref:YdhG-like domain-containing protein n=1 Tax=Alkalibacter saccharofermentans DSM 14828 TaxID=1120975 RepID=A0A1M4U3F6_9FIRM|nr:DUF1801 domain-containing protein [Alkalibacter saccharofermentans]SHE51174.1 protein of unknown function (DU1801) [Alkalibacter saccharofermentans DSM 14828]